MSCTQIPDVVQVLDVVLKDGWQSTLLNTHEDVFSYLDNEKLSKLSNDVVNQLLKKPCFSEPQKAFIRERRRKSLSSRAAKRHRDGEKERVQEMQNVIDSLKGEREQLKDEYENLLEEIRMYREAGIDVELT